MKKTMFLIFVLSCLAGGTTFASSSQIGRYVTASNSPTSAQINPLLAVAQYKFSSSVTTVGAAIDQVLATTGYKLVPQKQLTKAAQETLVKPLPITVRNLGPISVKGALEVLMGKEVFNLVVDPLHRLISFKVKSSIAKELGVGHE